MILEGVILQPIELSFCLWCRNPVSEHWFESQVLAASLPIPLLVNVPGKAVEGPRVFETLAAMWKLWAEPQDLGFGLLISTRCDHLERPLPLSLPFARPLFFSNK